MGNRTSGYRAPTAASAWTLHRVAAIVIRYYAALRISTAAATALLPVELRLDVPPIVRPSHNRLVDGFDRRELIQLNGRQLVVMLDDRRTSRHGGSGFFSN